MAWFSNAMQNNPQAILGLASGLMSNPRDSRAALGAGFRNAMLGAQADTGNQRNQLMDQMRREAAQRAQQEMAWKQEDRQRQADTRALRDQALTTLPEADRNYYHITGGLPQPVKPSFTPYERKMDEFRAEEQITELQNQREAQNRAGVLQRGLNQMRLIGQTVDDPDNLVGDMQTMVGRGFDQVFGGEYASGRSRVRSTVARLKVELSSALEGQGPITEGEREMIGHTIAELDKAETFQDIENVMNDGIQFYESIASGQSIEDTPRPQSNDLLGAADAIVGN